MYALDHSVSGLGEEYYQRTGYYDFFRNDIGFIVVGTTVALIIAIVLIIDMLKNCMSRKVQILLLAIVLIFEFAIVADISIETSKSGVWQDKTLCTN